MIMKKTDIKGLSQEELKNKIGEEEQVLGKLRFAHAISPIENPMKIRASRKLIAQMKTELRAKSN